MEKAHKCYNSPKPEANEKLQQKKTLPEDQKVFRACTLHGRPVHDEQTQNYKDHMYFCAGLYFYTKLKIISARAIEKRVAIATLFYIIYISYSIPLLLSYSLSL